MLEGLCFKHTDVYNYIKYYTNQDGHHTVVLRPGRIITHASALREDRCTPNAPCWLPGFAQCPIARSRGHPLLVGFPTRRLPLLAVLVTSALQ